MNDFVREFFEDQPELLRRYERNEARYILQLPKNYDTISIDFGIDKNEYGDLTEKQKRQYIFHRWNDPYGDYWIYRTIADRIWTLKGLFAEACDSDIGGSLYQGIEDSQIRVYVYRS